MESIEIYNLIKCAQKDVKNSIVERVRKALSFEYSRDVKREKKWTKKEQLAYIKALETICEIIQYH